MERGMTTDKERRNHRFYTMQRLEKVERRVRGAKRAAAEHQQLMDDAHQTNLVRSAEK